MVLGMWIVRGGRERPASLWGRGVSMGICWTGGGDELCECVNPVGGGEIPKLFGGEGVVWRLREWVED